MGWHCKNWTMGAILVSSLAFAGKKEMEEEGRLLLDRAVQLSDIRAAGAPAFRLKADLKVIHEGSIIEGTYTETWLSRGRWRKETTLGELHRTVVADGQSLWTLGDISQSVTAIGELGFPIDRLAAAGEFWKADKIEDREIGSLPARCIETKAHSQGSRSALCFAKDRGLLLAKAVPTEVQDKMVERSCEYRDYQEFNGKTFPRQILCFDSLKPVFGETILELKVTPSPDPAIFTPPVGATQSTNCQGVINPPTPSYTPDPEVTRRETPKSPVDIELLVQADGKTSDLKVVKSIDEAFDQAAVKAVQKWRFKPATCDGVPLAYHIHVWVSFHLY